MEVLWDSLANEVADCLYCLAIINKDNLPGL